MNEGYGLWRAQRLRERFLGWMADRYQGQAALTGRRALEFAEATLAEHLHDEGIAFGGDGGAWDEAAAHALVDEDLAHWEAE